MWHYSKYFLLWQILHLGEDVAGHCLDNFFFHKTLFHIIYIFWQCILTVSMSTSCCWYIIFTLSWQNTVTSVISSYKYIYCKYRKTIWIDLSNSNSSRPVLQIPQCIRQTSLNAPLRTEMCPSPLWTVHRGTLPRHHWGHRWLSIRISPSARRCLAHRLKATSCGRKWAQMAILSRKMSPSAFSRRCQAPPGGETAQMARHGVTRKGWQGATARMNTWRLRCRHRYHFLANDKLISSRCGAADKWLSCTTT